MTDAAVPSPRKQIAIAFVVACAFLMQGIDSTLLTIALPRIASDLGASALSLHLLITAYLLSLAVFMPVSGWFADRFGARRVFVVALGIFMAASLVCALMPGLWTMLPWRMVQGFGGALMTPVGRMIVLRAFGPGRTLEAMTWLTIPVLIGPLVGPLIGAGLIEFAHWRMLFLVNLPICLLALVGTACLIPKQPAAPRRPFDCKGFLIAGAALVSFQIAVECLALGGLGVWAAALVFCASGLVFWLYCRHARQTLHPALDLALFAKPAFSIGVLAGGIGRAGLNASAFLLPLMLQLGLGFRPIVAGALAALAGLGSLVSKPLLKRLVARFGFRRILMVLTLAGSASMLVYAWPGPQWPLWALVGVTLLSGAIRTLHFNSVNTLTYAALDGSELSRAVSSAGVFQQLTMGLGISLSAAVLQILHPLGTPPGLAQFQTAFLIMGLIPLLSLPVIARLRPEDLLPDATEKTSTRASKYVDRPSVVPARHSKRDTTRAT